MKQAQGDPVLRALLSGKTPVNKVLVQLVLMSEDYHLYLKNVSRLLGASHSFVKYNRLCKTFNILHKSTHNASQELSLLDNLIRSRDNLRCHLLVKIWYHLQCREIQAVRGKDALDTFLLIGTTVKVNARKLNFEEETNKSKLKTAVAIS